jgi:TFIIF-interacting CTD phosphatase-like protein
MYRNVVLLDLDGTLLYGTANNEELYNTCPDIVNADFRVWFRPGAKEMIKHIQQYFDVGVWTAATENYAMPIIDILFDTPPFIVCTSIHCLKISLYGDSFMIKPLECLRDIVHISKVLIVDDNPDTYIDNPHNAVPVKSWTPNELTDITLSKLSIYLVKKFGTWRGSVVDVSNGWWDN